MHEISLYIFVLSFEEDKYVKYMEYWERILTSSEAEFGISKPELFIWLNYQEWSVNFSTEKYIFFLLFNE